MARPIPPDAGALTAADVELLYRELLGRPPLPSEVAQQLQRASSLRELMVAICASPERQAMRPMRAPPARPLDVVNVYTPELAPWGHPPGTWSSDGVAVVGREGWVFLGSGSNAILDQYQGAIELPDDWHADWVEAVALRRRGAAAVGAEFVGVIVPDKLPVLRSAFPEDLPEDVRAPAAVLVAHAELGLLYPVGELQAVPEDAYLRTDTHLTFAGNRELARVVLQALGLALPSETPPMCRYASSGDLGSRLVPPAVEVVTAGDGLGLAEIVESNHGEISAVGANLGTRQLLRNERAVDRRTAVVFGDSYAVAAPHYQGLAWWLAQVFREVHFLWAPFGWDPEYVERVRPGVVACESAERFVIRPPAPRVDVAQLAADALARGQSPPPAEEPRPAEAPDGSPRRGWRRRAAERGRRAQPK